MNYNVINRCLSTLKSSRIDAMTKLRMENLLIGMKVLMLMDPDEQNAMPEIEELFTHVNEVCSGQTTDGLNGLMAHVRNLQSSMAACLNLSC
ncbi:hypothetical protein [Geomonas sp.]|uniref:hypothetical protein n=1 Tax=Geomonas sp. TaxID=2651584 RepID=UPI002B473B16|nr:hypothetical protein [Geomonas sp.]HJV33596.1 hypothetical protein [Geomonas sp.]